MQQQTKGAVWQERRDSVRSYFGSGNENKRSQPNTVTQNKTNAQGSGRKRWGEGIKDSTDEFESLLNEIDSKPVSYSKKVGDNAEIHLTYVYLNVLSDLSLLLMIIN